MMAPRAGPGMLKCFTHCGANSALIYTDPRFDDASDLLDCFVYTARHIAGVDSYALDERMDDLQGVMDAAEINNAGLFGICEGGPISMLFRGVTHPQRLHSLAVCGTSPGVGDSKVLPPPRLSSFGGPTTFRSG
jgi:hypothetical protein